VEITKIVDIVDTTIVGPALFRWPAADDVWPDWVAVGRHHANGGAQECTRTPAVESFRLAAHGQ
jgi:hypothetical protein